MSINSKLIENKRLQKLLVVVLGFSYAGVLIKSYGSFIQGDFQIFWNAGQRIHSGINLYNDNSYFSGPILAITLSLFSFLSAYQASLAFLLLNFALIPILLVKTGKLFPDLDKNILNYFGSIAFLCSFTFRNSIGNGQVVLVCLTLLIYGYTKIRENVLNFQLFLGALLICFSIELKPYLVLPLILVLVLNKKIRAIIALIASSVILNFAYFMIFKDATWFNWADAMFRRSDNLGSDISQTNVRTLLMAFFNVPNFISSAVLLISVLTILIVSSRYFFRQTEQYQILLALTLGPIISVFSHEQDFIFPLLVLIVIVASNKNLSSFSTLAFGCLLNLTSASPVVFIAIVILLLLAVDLYLVTDFKYLLLIFATSLIIEALAIFILETNGSARQFLFHNFIAYCFGVFIWANQIFLEKSSRRATD